MTSLSLLFVMCFISTWMIPVPITAYVMWLGQFDFPLAIILLSTVGTLLGWMTFVPVLRRLLKKRPSLAQKIPASYQAILMRHTGLSLFVFNAAPFPIDPIRFMALMNGYPQSRMLVAMGAGRLIRNALLVYLGAVLVKYTVLFWGVMGVMMLLPMLLGRLFQVKVAGLDKQDVIAELADELRAGVAPRKLQK